MTGFLLDANIPSELTRPKSDRRVEEWLEAADGERLYVSVIPPGKIFKVLTPLPAGKRRDQLTQWVKETLRPWFDGRILTVSEAIGERWGVLAGERQLKGRLLKIADGLIAATAASENSIRRGRRFRSEQAEAGRKWLRLVALRAGFLGV
jgi:toxin FitB